jgi:hypothetical protein
VLFVGRSMHTGLGVRSLICPAGSALRSDHSEVCVEVECDLMKKSHILLS